MFAGVSLRRKAGWGHAVVADAGVVDFGEDAEVGELRVGVEAAPVDDDGGGHGLVLAAVRRPRRRYGGRPTTSTRASISSPAATRPRAVWKRSSLDPRLAVEGALEPGPLLL